MKLSNRFASGVESAESHLKKLPELDIYFIFDLKIEVKVIKEYILQNSRFLLTRFATVFECKIFCPFHFRDQNGRALKKRRSIWVTGIFSLKI